ncbi:MAG: ATP-binding cassette domain-containing protein, partial [Deltaproteobacteria bacterium]|nr:ATP-binding cassette domain-containing protein [Deltaproteobacteria bacterium]
MRKLAVHGLVKAFGKKKAVDGLSMDVSSGTVVGLLGPNGAGKTTTFYMTVGLVSPDQGRVLLDDTDITGMPMYRRARLGISYLAQ